MKTQEELFRERAFGHRRIETRYRRRQIALTTILVASAFALLASIPIGGKTGVVILTTISIAIPISFGLLMMDSDAENDALRRFKKNFDARADVRYYEALREAESFERIGKARQRNGFDKDDLEYYQRMARKWREKAKQLAAEADKVENERR